MCCVFKLPEGPVRWGSGVLWGQVYLQAAGNRWKARFRRTTGPARHTAAAYALFQKQSDEERLATFAALRAQLRVRSSLTERCDAVELGLVHEHVHVDGARVELFGPQEVEDGREQGGVPVDEDLQRDRRDKRSYREEEKHAGTWGRGALLTAPVSSFRVEIRPLKRLKRENPQRNHRDVRNQQTQLFKIQEPVQSHLPFISLTRQFHHITD